MRAEYRKSLRLNSVLFSGSNNKANPLTVAVISIYTNNWHEHKIMPRKVHSILTAQAILYLVKYWFINLESIEILFVVMKITHSRFVGKGFLLGGCLLLPVREDYCHVKGRHSLNKEALMYWSFHWLYGNIIQLSCSTYNDLMALSMRKPLPLKIWLLWMVRYILQMKLCYFTCPPVAHKATESRGCSRSRNTTSLQDRSVRLVITLNKLLSPFVKCSANQGRVSLSRTLKGAVWTVVTSHSAGKSHRLVFGLAEKLVHVKPWILL